MTFFPVTRNKFADSTSVDACDRLRTSTPFTIFDSKQLFDSRDYYWATKFINSATSSFSVETASTKLKVAAISGSRVIRQTKQTFRYQPGKSFLSLDTFNFNSAEPGVVKRVGYYNDLNGIFLELSGSDLNFVIRTNGKNGIVENRISQSNWNKDKLDGTGASSTILNIDKIQIFAVDFQWLGAGRVRTGFVLNGKTVTAHEFRHANNNTHVYMSNPNLPVRYEVINLSNTNTGTLEQICSSVVSEGGVEPTGIAFGVDRGTNALQTTQGKTVPLLSIRINPSKSKPTIIPSGMELLSTSNTDLRWGIYLNPTFGSDNADWKEIELSSMQYDVSRTQNNILSGGLLLKSGYLAGASKISNDLQEIFNIGFSLGADLDNNVDEMVLAVETITTGAANIYGSIFWKELD